MTIPGDLLNRQWVDVSSTNPNLVNEHRQTLVSFLGFDHSKNAKLEGTGFVIAGNEECAVVFTAKHVLEGIKKFQNPRPIYHPSSPFVSDKHLAPNIEPTHLKVVWMGQENALLMNVAYAFYGKSWDVACCIVMPQENDRFSPVSIPLDFRTPGIGDLVHMISCNGMHPEEAIPTRTQDGPIPIVIKRAVNIRIGRVTGVYEQGLRQYKWPCFTTSIPAEPGMSGGFVCLPEAGATVSACGVVCADFSTKGAMGDMLQSGDSVIACTWPGLGLRVPDKIPHDDTAQGITIYDMIKTGRMGDVNSAIEQFEVIELEGDDCRVRRID